MRHGEDKDPQSRRAPLRRAKYILAFVVLLTAGFASSTAFGRVLVGASSTDPVTATDSTSAGDTGSTDATTSADSTTTDTSSDSTTTTDSTSTTTDATPTTPAVFNPTIASDQPDYSPGATVTLTGAGWAPMDAVHIFVNDDEGQTWSYNGDTAADGNGAFTFRFQLPTSFVAAYSVTATGALSGTARTTFTDGNVTLHLPASEGVADMTVTFDRFNGNTACTGTPSSTNQTISATSGNTVNIPGFGGNGDSVKLKSVSTTTTGKAFNSWTSGDKTTDSGTLVSGSPAPCISNSSGGSNGAVTDAYAHFRNASASTSTGLTSSANPSAYPASVTLTATVTATPTPNPNGVGTVMFKDGGTTLCGGAITLSGNTATCTPSPVLAAGSHSLTADYSGTANFGPSTGSLTQNVNKGSQTITFVQPASPAAYGSSFAINPTASSGLPVAVGVTGPCSYNGSNGNVTMTGGSGTCSITASQAGDSNYNAATSVTRNVDAAKANQTITVTTHAPGTAVFNSSFSVAATASSGNAVAFSSSGSCSNTGASFTMTSGTGACTVKYDQAGDGNYNAAPQVTESVTASKATQVINVTTHAPASAAYGSSFSVAATGGGSGNAVTFSSGGSCSNAGATFTMTSGGGTCSVKYDQAGNANYDPAAQVTESVSATKAGQTITFAALPGKTYGDADFAVSASASSGLGVSFSVGAGDNCTISGNTIHITGAGSCTVTASQSGNADYNAAPDVSRSFSIAKASQTISFDALADRTYGESPVALSASTSSGLAVGFGASGPCAVIAGPKVRLDGAGQCTVTAFQGGDANYAPATAVDRSFQIAKADLSITADDKHITYPADRPAFTVGYAGFVNSDGPGSLGGTLACDTSPASSATSPNAGTYAIVCSGLTSGNYDIHYHPGTLVVDKGSQTISFDALADRTYGDGPVALSASSSSGLAVSFAADGNCAIIAGPKARIDGAGTCTITAGQPGSDNWNAATEVSRTFQIAKAPLTITASSPADVVYGDDAPAVTASYDGFVNGDDAESLSTKPTCGTGYSAGNGVGTYPTSCSGAASHDYDFHYVAGSFDVVKKALTITASSPANVVYGSAAPAVTASYDGFISGDNADSLTTKPNCGTPYSAGSPVGTYATSCSGAEAHNYDISYANGSFDVLKKALTITASSPNDVTYGDAAPEVSPLYDGFISGDNADSLSTKPTCGTAYAAGNPVGTYATSCSGAAAHNYDITYLDGSFKVLKKGLTITASSPNAVTYGDAAPEIHASYDGFISGDNADSLTTKPNCGTPYSAGSAVGTYATSCSGAETHNYEVSYVNGSFDVLKKALTITASSPQDITYGDASPAIHAIYDGFISGDNADNLSTKPSCDTGYGVGSPVGTYTTSCSGAAAHNYELHYVDGSFHVLKKALTITASSPSDIVYGSAKPEIDPIYDGFINGDNADSLSTKPSCNTDYAVGSAVGTYATSCSGAEAHNYEISYAAGSFKVTKKALTITASSPDAIVYGSAKPEIHAIYDGFISGDGADSLTTKPTCDSSYSLGDPVGHYATSCAGAASGNYDISYAGGGFDVTKKALTITASSPADIVYGSAKPAISASPDGLVAGDTLADLNVDCGTGYSAGDPVGTYATSCAASGGKTGNYDITYVTGSFHVLKKALTITASSPEDLVYGSAKPEIHPLYDGFISGDNADNLSTKPSCDTGYGAGSPVGTYATSCSGAAAHNYDISYIAGSFKVTKKALTITASSPADIVYGSGKPEIHASADGLVAGDTLGDLNTDCTTGYSAGDGVGTYATSCSASGGKTGNYDITYVAGSFHVLKKALTITASSPDDVVYGSAAPAVAPSYDGFISGDNDDSLSTKPSCGTAYAAGSPAATYATSCSGAAAHNYEISYVNGSFKVTRKALTITASSPVDIVYGSAKPDVHALYDGFISGDNADSLTTKPSCGTAYAVGSPVGHYATSCSGAASGNYDISYAGGGFDVTKKALTIIASSPANIVYGSPAPTVTASYDGFVAGDGPNSLATKPSCGTGYAAGNDVGPYATTCSGADAQNYAISYAPGSFTVLKKALLITASSPADIVYGSPRPAVNPLYDGFISGDDASKLSTQPTCGTAYSLGNGVGTYATACSGAAAGNYDVSYAPGSFKVTKKALTITASSPADLVYGSAPPAVTASADGLVAGDSISDLNATCGTPYSAGNNVGTYATSCAASAGKSPNYDITYVAGSFKVTKKALTISASSPADIVYGSAKPSVTASPSGLVAGDTLSDLNVACTTGYSAGDPIGTYATSCAASGGKSGNYDIAYVAGSFKVTKKSLTITASSPADIVYGSPKPAISASASGLIAQDGLGDLNVSCATPYSAGDPVGSYATNCEASGGRSGNYDITYVAGSFNVTKKTLTITASSPADITYGAPVPAVTPLYDGFISGQDASNLTTKPTCGTTYTPASAVGTYPTTCSGAASGNYAFVYVAGSLKVFYGWSGFLQPINDTAHFVSLSMSVFKAGSTVPVKFQLTNAAGASVQSGGLPQWVTPTVVGTTSAPVGESVYTDAPMSGSTYRWDGTQYIFNWQSPKADVGKVYRIGVRLDDGRTYYVNIGLK